MSDTLTAEQIEGFREEAVGRSLVGIRPGAKEQALFDIALCDLAIKGLHRPDLEAAARGKLIEALRGGASRLAVDGWSDLARILYEEAEAIRALATGQDAQAKCPACNGNNGDMPCAYPGDYERRPGCLKHPTGQDAQNAAAEPERRKVFARGFDSKPYFDERKGERRKVDLPDTFGTKFSGRHSQRTGTDRRKPGGKP